MNKYKISMIDSIYNYFGKIVYKCRKMHRFMPAKMYLQSRWRERRPECGELNIDNPVSFNEKLNWLKLYYHNPILHKLVDKYEVKQYVSRLIGAEHVVKTYGVYHSVKDIDFDSLPCQFVLKCTHDSGSVIVCTDKEKFNREKAKHDLKQFLKVTDYYYRNREWAYKGVKPRIIAEEYIDTLGKADSIEYKITCFYGKVKMVTVCSGIAHVEYEKRHNDHFDNDGNRLPFYASYTPAGKDFPDPILFDSMKQICEKLTQGLPECRVDLYLHKGIVYFGEMTFYTWGGFIDFTPKEWDLVMGKWFELPDKYN